MSFGDEIAQWASETQEELYEEVANKTKELFSNVIRFSPVLTGRFVANWHVGNNMPSFSTMETNTREQKIAEIVTKITPEFFMFNKSAYLTNNLDYVRNVEYDGWRMTGPYAPVAKAISFSRE